MCAKPLVSFYEGLFAFAAAFVAAVALGSLEKVNSSAIASVLPSTSQVYSTPRFRRSGFLNG